MVLMECCYLREQLGSVFYLRYLMVPTLRVFVLHQVFVVLFWRSTGRQRHLVPSPMLSSFVVCTAGVFVLRDPMWC